MPKRVENPPGKQTMCMRLFNICQIYWHMLIYLWSTDCQSEQCLLEILAVGAEKAALCEISAVAVEYLKTCSGSVRRSEWFVSCIRARGSCFCCLKSCIWVERLEDSMMRIDRVFESPHWIAGDVKCLCSCRYLSPVWMWMKESNRKRRHENWWLTICVALCAAR